MVQPLWKTVWQFLNSLNTKLPYDSEVPLLGSKRIDNIYPHKNLPFKGVSTDE